MRSKKFQCASCSSLEGYLSRPRNVIEQYVLPLLFLQPARCGDCLRRSYVWVFVPLKDRPRSRPNRQVA